MLRFITDINIEHNLIYPVMTAFTDQYSLPNIVFFCFFLFIFFFLNCKIHQYRIEYNNIITYKTSYNLYSKVQLNLLTIFSNI